jgi:mono/diheme cytochrome c family protein
MESPFASMPNIILRQTAARRDCLYPQLGVIVPMKTIHTPLAPALILSILVTSSAVGADAGNGERLAERWCSACHVVTNIQRQANADAPPFQEIAKRPNFSESGLTTFLLDPHAKMPNMDLTRIEAGDIAAYVARLR